jgi:Fuc2NAc and GlcNAc transferase
MVASSFFAIVLGTALSWGLLRVLIIIFRYRLLDQPNKRSSHYKPTPRGGGVAFVLVSSVASVTALLMKSNSVESPSFLILAPLLALPLAVVGFLDDLHDLPPTLRYGVQLATGLLVVLFSPLVVPSVGLILLITLLLIATTAIINFTNFMDGLDGLVAGCMSVVITTAAIQLSAPWPIWALVGTLLGFLFWNWSPAKIFMGDVGSTFLGAVFACLVLHASSWPQAFGLLLVSTPLLGDACLCVPRRLLARQSVFQAHRLHLFQRIHQAGWPHARVSTLYIASTTVLAIALLSGGLSWVITLASVELLIGFWLDQKVAVPFSVASRS